ncbi:tetratricopeptide repeat protein 21B isoform X1 [Dendroctonus ponderosae]|uniref:tetratricopeptide repeat protein 21B isoform X1 n=1 Tax=Dendroctonus ponderosae TaxID=77166 RepID=UPI0020365CE9|nr:tetratricopeptide repeat protein 21B isoform X1 [Dendroctonus ponderosae]XP_019763182.2 tetratricopeptide repeat protein 21B isoform X1 [Dendroctonus ponderosae]XP_019763183.2 tetratricopeptide repeat protein 21B isoform X1 [Dendroctonus ponderosae]
MAASDSFARIFFHFHHKHFNLMVGACKDAIGKFPADPSFKLYHSLALILTNRLEEGVNDLEGLTHENDIKLACTIALMYAHKFLGVASRELFVKLDIQMKEYRKSAEAHDFYNSAFVLITLNKSEKALDYAEKAISLKSDGEFSSLKGWILLTLKTLGKHNASNIKAIFSKALQDNPKDLLAILGVTECCLYLSEFREALSLINQAVVKFTSTSLPLLEKIKVHFAAQDWDQTLEAINRFSSADCELLYGTKYEILISLCHSQDYKATCSGIRRFSDLARKFEPNNTAVILEASRLFSKVSAKRESILNETIAMLEGVMQTNIDSAELVVELGNQYLLLGRTKEAVRLFKSATKIDEGYFDAFLGLSVCEFMENGQSQQLFKQIQYLLELKDASNSLALHLLQAKAADSSVEALSHLKVIFDIKTHLLQANYYSEKYLINLDPDFTLDVIREYLQHATTNKQVLEHALELANVVAKACPSLSEAVYLQAKLQHLKGDSISALRTLETMANMSEAASSEAGLLMAQIQVNNGQFDRASQSLEACMSSNFKIRENPMCHYITALVDKHSGNYGDAIKALSTALTLMNITVKNNDVSLIDKASIYVELIDTLNIVGQSDEAQKILEEATHDLQGTPEEARILLLSADNLVVRGNIQGALELLGKIGKGESCYKEARMKMADMFLTNRRDKHAFLEVYQDFVKEQPSAESYVLLGDACMKILEPDDALQNYEKALKENPNDLFLMRKMGKALVQTHYFNRAVEYYKKSIKEVKDPELTLQLADLYLNLREYEKGELLLLDELDEEHRKSMAEDINDLLYQAKLYSLLAEIQEKSGNFTFAVKSLKDAMDCQMRVRKRYALEQNVASEEIDRQLVDISLKLGEMAISMKSNEQAVSYYKEGLTVSPNNTSILVALAKLYMQMNYLELCQQTCAIILRIDQDNEAASVLMADIAFRKVDFDMALFHFTQLVSKQPCNWDALIRLIEISRRLGTIQECEHYVVVAEEKCANPLKEAGLLYSKAYFQWHSGNLNAALKNFNQVRQDPEYGSNALYNMIEICLNPDGEMLAEQFMDSDDIEYRDSRFLALKTADRLIKDLRQRLEFKGEDLLRCRLLANFRLLATKEKYNIERALEDFVAVASQNDHKENLGAILGMSTAYTLLKQQQRAKNQLKRVVKNAWNFEDAHYLEKCWLLLADQYIQSNKLDSANELIAKVVQHNKACIKALEYLGYICEKEHKYKEAARNYQQAWKVGMKSNASTGFKSAYCLMKCKKYPDAIDTANEVLQLNPDYANVKKDILDKCMNNLRV